MAFSISLLALVLSVFLFLLPADGKTAISGGARVEPHDFRGHGYECKSCHVSVGLKTRGKMLKPVSEICGVCHRFSGQSHPVDIAPTIPIPPDMPLDETGKMTCATCHDPHRPYLNPLNGQRTVYLRRDEPKRLHCAICHKK